MPILKCANCGKEYKGRNKKYRKNSYCSKECFIEYKTIIIKCKECNKEFRIPKCRYNIKSFCSTECVDKNYAKQNKKVSKRGNYKTKNIYNIKENYAELVITNTFNINKTVLIDIEDIETLKEYHWRVLNNNYVQGIKNKHNYKIHRVVMSCPDDLVVDHINHNPLDNRKENLRICTNAENQQNILNRKNYRLVKVINRQGREYKYYKAYIVLNGKTYLKYFPYTKEGLNKAKKYALELRRKYHKFSKENIC